MLLRFVPALIGPALMAATLAITPAHAAAPRKPAPRPVVKEAPYNPPPLRDVEKVAITTELGTITLELDGKHAPITTANFLHYVDTKRYDGIIFYRVMHLAWGDQPNGLIQGGIRDARLLYPPIAHEPTSQTGVLHKKGAISLARLAVGTGQADFSILLSDIEGLDADPKASDPEAQAGYAAFGHVTEGMDVVRQIWDQPTDPNQGEGIMKGQILAKPVKVLTVRRVP